MLCLVLVVAGLCCLLLAGILYLVKLGPEFLAKELESADLGAHHFVEGKRGLTILLTTAALVLASFFRVRRQLQGRWRPWLMVGAICALLLLLNFLMTGIGFIARYLTNALVERDRETTKHMLVIYGACLVAALPARSLQFYLLAKLSLTWRVWLSKCFIDAYMSNRAYYSLNPNEEDLTNIDNPDQRIADDTMQFTTQSVEFAAGSFDALLTLAFNIIVLWSISRTLTLALVAYSCSVSFLMAFASQRLVRIYYNQSRYQADLRFCLMHVRNNAEAIAFYSGEAAEKAEVNRRLSIVVTNTNYLIKWKVVIGVLRRCYDYAGNFLPYLLMAPAYLNGDIDYGSFIQARFSFSMVEGALSFVVSNVDELAAWWAGIDRLEGFQRALRDFASGEAEPDGPDGRDGTTVKPAQRGSHADAELADALSSSTAIILRDVWLKAPGADRFLVDGLSISVGRGERLLLVGPSGCGKTSVLRAACGLWKPDAGSVERPPLGKMLFVPQRPYMILGSLREQLSYPHAAHAFCDDELKEALKDVKLGQFLERYPDFGVKQDWQRVLSLGEQQRLSFARLLLNGPEFVILDEATSALDLSTEQKLYELLLQRNVAIISVGHRPSLASFHEQVLELGGHGGSWRLMPSASYDFAQGAGEIDHV